MQRMKKFELFMGCSENGYITKQVRQPIGSGGASPPAVFYQKNGGKNMRYNKTYRIFDTREDAEKFIKTLGKRKYTLVPWLNWDNKPGIFVVWYYTKAK